MISNASIKKNIPGPGFLKFVKNVRDNPVLYLHELMKEYGDVVRCRSVQDIYLVSNPVLAKEIFLNVHRAFDKGNFINRRLQDVMGDGVVLTNGAKWKRQRKTTQIVFKKEELQKLVPEILFLIDDMIDSWKAKSRQQESLNVQKEITQLIMKVMAGCLFRLEDDKIMEQLKTYFIAGNEYVSNPIPFNLPGWIPLSRRSRVNKAVKGIDGIIMSMMKERGLTEKYEERLLAYIMDQVDENGNRLTDEDILAEIKNVFVAGYFSTSDVLSWLIYSLAQHPEWNERLLAECSVFKNSNDPDSLESAMETQFFIHEVLRCYPPVWGSSHHTIRDVELGEYLIPENKTVLISIYNLHHHPAFWSHPDKFDPLRFAEFKRQQENAMFIPFGIGPRKCLGMGLARMVINMVFAKIVTHFRLLQDMSVVPAIQSRVTLGAKVDLRIFAKPR